MYSILLLLKGLLIGIAIAIPVGPVNLICIQKTIDGGRIKGLVSGLGATLADTTYGAIAIFGVGFLSTFMLDYSSQFKLIGGTILMILAYRMITRIKKPVNITLQSKKTLIQTFSTTFAVTISNPITILAFIAIYAALGISEITRFDSSLIIVAGIFLGALSWWTFLSYVVNKVRDHFNYVIIRKINIGSGIAIALFAAIILLTSLSELFPDTLATPLQGFLISF